jgi:hypothetical protein
MEARAYGDLLTRILGIARPNRGSRVLSSKGLSFGKNMQCHRRSAPELSSRPKKAVRTSIVMGWRCV